MLKEKSSDKPYRWAERIKQAKWNVRLIPFGIAFLIAISLYCVLFPGKPISTRDEILLSVMFGGVLLWLQALYSDEKYLLRTGQERFTLEYTLALLVCLTTFYVSLYFDPKMWRSFGFWMFAFSIHLLQRIVKHVTVFRAAHQSRRDR